MAERPPVEQNDRIRAAVAKLRAKGDERSLEMATELESRLSPETPSESSVQVEVGEAEFRTPDQPSSAGADDNGDPLPFDGDGNPVATESPDAPPPEPEEMGVFDAAGRAASDALTYGWDALTRGGASAYAASQDPTPRAAGRGLDAPEEENPGGVEAVAQALGPDSPDSQLPPNFSIPGLPGTGIPSMALRTLAAARPSSYRDAAGEMQRDTQRAYDERPGVSMAAALGAGLGMPLQLPVSVPVPRAIAETAAMTKPMVEAAKRAGQAVPGALERLSARGTQAAANLAPTAAAEGALYAQGHGQNPAEGAAQGLSAAMILGPLGEAAMGTPLRAVGDYFSARALDPTKVGEEASRVARSITRAGAEPDVGAVAWKIPKSLKQMWGDFSASESALGASPAVAKKYAGKLLESVKKIHGEAVSHANHLTEQYYATPEALAPVRPVDALDVLSRAISRRQTPMGRPLNPEAVKALEKEYDHIAKLIAPVKTGTIEVPDVSPSDFHELKPGGRTPGSLEPPRPTVRPGRRGKGSTPDIPKSPRVPVEFANTEPSPPPQTAGGGKPRTRKVDTFTKDYPNARGLTALIERYSEMTDPAKYEKGVASVASQVEATLRKLRDENYPQLAEISKQKQQFLAPLNNALKAIGYSGKVKRFDETELSDDFIRFWSAMREYGIDPNKTEALDMLLKQSAPKMHRIVQEVAAARDMLKALESGQGKMREVVNPGGVSVYFSLPDYKTRAGAMARTPQTMPGKRPTATMSTDRIFRILTGADDEESEE